MTKVRREQVLGGGGNYFWQYCWDTALRNKSRVIANECEAIQPIETPTSKSKISVLPRVEDMQVSCHSELVSESNKSLPQSLGGDIEGESLYAMTLNKAPHPNHPRSRGGKRAAFTLAEVLITLGIIGVVAAMTIPNLMAKYNEIQTVQKVKKFYSMISQAFQLAREEYGDVESWDTTDDTEESFGNAEAATNYAKYIKPHLKIAVDCESGPCDKYMNNSNLKLLNKGQGWNYTENKYYKLVLNDGSLFWFRVHGNHCDSVDGIEPNVCALIWYDINGKRGPKTLGKDVFVFYVKAQSVIPHSADDCYLDSAGWGCAKYIIQHGDMKYPKTKSE